MRSVRPDQDPMQAKVEVGKFLKSEEDFVEPRKTLMKSKEAAKALSKDVQL